MVRTAKLRSFRRRMLRFTTPGRPGAAAACYVALWRLPRPDFHRLVIRTFQGAPFGCYAVTRTLSCKNSGAMSAPFAHTNV